jgi:aspartyl-tRNA(Asn)/glutamyl-tRNA(Gln) amidotransferase subunit B
MSDWKLTVGMEVHIELETQTKMFCGCKNDPFGSQPNTNVCPVCYGLPGALPLLNREAIKMTVKLGRALKGNIALKTFWARKNYFYPDLPKGYQISQSISPIVGEAILTIDGVDHRIERIHLEEDAGKLSHAGGSSLVDFNRAGVPLMEIVTHPDFHTAEDAKRFCQELQRIVRTLNIASADMEKGRMRCEANISVSKTDEMGTKVEVKNINSFRAVEKAIKYEYDRQIEALEKGEKIIQETRTWDDAGGKTVSMRTKETSADYRYFPEPDLPVVEIADEAGEGIVLPDEQKSQLIEAGVGKDLAQVIVDRHQAEKLLKFESQAGELAKIYLAKPETLDLADHQIMDLLEARRAYNLTKDQISKIVDEVKTKPELNLIMVAQDMAGGGLDLGALIKEVTENNPKAIADYKSGKENAYQFLVGQVMAKAQGKANIQQVRELLKETLS